MALLHRSPIRCPPLSHVCFHLGSVYSISWTTFHIPTLYNEAKPQFWSGPSEMTFLPLTLHAWSFLQNDLKCEHRFRRYRSSKYHILSFGQLYCWSFGLYIGSFVRCTRNSFTVRPDMTNNVDLSRCFPDRSTYVRERAFNKDLLCRGGIKVNTATSIMF